MCGARSWTTLGGGHALNLEMADVKVEFEIGGIDFLEQPQGSFRGIQSIADMRLYGKNYLAVAAVIH